MPPLSIWTLRLALVYLGLGFTAGALALINKGIVLSPWIFHAMPLHRDLMIYGWTLHLIVGVAYWILPTFGSRKNRGREGFALASVIQLSAATIIGSFAALPATPPVFATVAAVLAATGVLSFAVHLWPRVKAFGG
ncbi:MAG: hypothetical protein ACNA8W_21600 [Bradymonadaceae bacterium]